MATFRVLIVCVGNVCRSPFGEMVLSARLPESFEVASAGIAAMVDQPMTPEAAVHLEPLGLSADGFRSRQLVPAMVDQADLVLTATKAIRSRVLEDSPGALRRTFTVRELAALVEIVGADHDPSRLVRTAADERSRASLDDYDIPDPMGRGEEVNALAASLMGEAVEKIAKGLAP